MSFGVVEAEAAGGSVFENALAVIKQAKMKSLSVIPIEFPPSNALGVHALSLAC
jgi:hypothetical protein